MKKLSFEDGRIVLRNLDGTFFWARHWYDLKNSDRNGYVDVCIEGTLTQESEFFKETKHTNL